jgi:hypothetical protein
VSSMYAVSHLGIPLAAVSAGHEPLATVLLEMLLRVPALHFSAALILAVHGFVSTVPLMLLKEIRGFIYLVYSLGMLIIEK